MLDHEIRHAARGLLRRPGFTLAAAITLAAGIGATAALWSILDGVLLRPLPYSQPTELVQLFERNVEQNIEPTSAAPATILEWQRATTLAAVAGWWVDSTTLLAEGALATEEMPSAAVTAEFFRVLAVEPVLGRTFAREEVAREERVTVLSYSLWQRRFGGSPEVLGREMAGRDGAWRVIGVMPEGFGTPGTRPDQVQLWKPWDFRVGFAHLPEVPRDQRFVRAAGRLAPGATVAAANAELDGIARSLAERFPDTNHGWGVEVVSLHELLVGGTRPVLLVLLAAVVAVWLLACANVAGLLLVRASGRGPEMALRAALGASRLRLARQLLVESLLLAGLGGLLGVGVAAALVRVVARYGPASVPRLDQSTLDLRAIAVTVAVTLAAGLVTGLVPALRGWSRRDGSKLGPGAAQVGAKRSTQRARAWLVIAEIAAALVLLTSAGLLVRSFHRMQQLDLGFIPDDLLVVRIRLDASSYGGGRANPYYRQLLERLRAVPSVTAAGGTTGLPFDEADIDFDRPFWRVGEPRPRGGGPGAQVRMVTMGYFETLQIPLIAGRQFDLGDDLTKSRRLIVNQTMADRTWPGDDPIGQRLFLDYQSYQDEYEVVGVVGDTRFYGHREATRPAVYIPHAQNAYLPLNLVVRSVVPPGDLAETVRGVILELDPAQPAHSVGTMAGLIDDRLERDGFVTVLLSAFAGLALLLAAIGIYGVVAYGIGQRRREFGLRLALGAVEADIRRMVLSGGLALAGVGVGLGILGAIVLNRFLATLLFEVSAVDVPTFATAAVGLLATVALACWLPARRAARIDPTLSLRSE